MKFKLDENLPRPNASPVLLSRRFVVPSKTRPLSSKELANFEVSREEEWEREADRRVAELNSGAVEAVPGEQAMASLRASLG